MKRQSRWEGLVGARRAACPLKRSRDMARECPRRVCGKDPCDPVESQRAVDVVTLAMRHAGRLVAEHHRVSNDVVVEGER